MTLPDPLFIRAEVLWRYENLRALRRAEKGRYRARDKNKAWVGGKRKRVMKASRAAESLGVQAHNLIRWEKRGWIPEPIIGGSRAYTYRQVRMIGWLTRFWVRWKGVPRTNPHRRRAWSRMITLIHKHWRDEENVDQGQQS